MAENCASMHPILQEIERAYSEAHRRVPNVEVWEEEHWGIIDDAFMSANNRIAALEAQVERYRAALAGLVDGPCLPTCSTATSSAPCDCWTEQVELALATAGPGCGVVGERWIVDLRDWGGYFLKTESGDVVREGLTQQEACRLANEHNGDQEYPIIDDDDHGL